jgi:hypothetical protein
MERVLTRRRPHRISGPRMSSAFSDAPVSPRRSRSRPVCSDVVKACASNIEWLLSDLSGDRARPGATLVPLREGIADLPRRVTLAQAINARYLDALSVMAQPTPVHLLRDPVSRPRLVNGRRYRALRPITADESRCFQRLLDGRTLLDGIPGRVTCTPC